MPKRKSGGAWRPTEHCCSRGHRESLCELHAAEHIKLASKGRDVMFCYRRVLVCCSIEWLSFLSLTWDKGWWRQIWSCPRFDLLDLCSSQRDIGTHSPGSPAKEKLRLCAWDRGGQGFGSEWIRLCSSGIRFHLFYSKMAAVPLTLHSSMWNEV